MPPSPTPPRIDLVERLELEVLDLDRGEVGGGRHEVVGERRCEQVAIVVVDVPLIEGLRDALHDAADDLAVDDRGVDERAAVFDHEVPRDRDTAGLGVDLHPTAVRGRGPAAGRGHLEVTRGLEALAQAFGE